MKNNIEIKIGMLNILGIERTSIEMIARNSVDLVMSLVILKSLTSLATVGDCPIIGTTESMMIAKSKQFQPSLK